MSAVAVTGMIASMGLAALGNAALTVLADIAMGIGALFMLAAALLPVGAAVGRRFKRREPLTVLAPPAPRPACPWCGTRECLDSTLCNCADPCGSWLCTVKEASRG